jgi:hypothetical protein
MQAFRICGARMKTECVRLGRFEHKILHELVIHKCHICTMKVVFFTIGSRSGPHRLMKSLPKARCSVTATKVAPMPTTFKLGAPATIKIVPQFPVAALGRSGPSIVIVAQKPPCT